MTTRTCSKWVLALAASCAVGAAHAAAGVGSLAGWGSLGDVAAQAGALHLSTAFVDGIADEAGNLSGLPAVAAGDLEAAAGLPPYALDLNPADYATEGSLVWQTITLAPGQGVWVRWSLDTADTTYADRAFMVLGNEVITLATAGQAPTGVQGLWRSSALGGNLVLGFGVVDSVDYAGVSTLNLLQLQVGVVPEPASTVLLLAGLGLMAAVVRRRAA